MPPTLTGPPAAGTRARAYRNLRWRPTVVYSIQAGGRVTHHVTDLTLVDVTVTIRASGQRRARTTGHRNVHAFVTGTLQPARPPGNWHRATYNPHLHDTFVDTTTLQPLPAQLAVVYLGADGMFYLR